MSEKSRRLISRFGAELIVALWIVTSPSAAQILSNDTLSVTVDPKSGSYQLALHNGQATLNSRAAAQVDHRWLRSSDYPQCKANSSVFSDALGAGQQVAVTCSGSDGKPNLVYSSADFLP